MAFWGSPDVKKLKEKRDTQGLIRALDGKTDAQLRRDAVEALGQTDDLRAISKLDAILQDQDEDILIRLEATKTGQLQPCVRRTDRENRNQEDWQFRWPPIAS